MNQSKISDFFNIKIKKEVKKKNYVEKKKYEKCKNRQKQVTKFFPDNKDDEIDLKIRNNILRVNREIGYQKIKYLEKLKKNSKIDYFIFEFVEVIDLISLFVRDIPNNKKYYNRLNEEFKLIKEKNFFKVFMQVKQILLLTDGIPHIIRGSSGSSVICYLMGITNIDPIKNNIPLTRFMHINRDNNPDIDIDFPAHLRDYIYEIIFRKWGDRVARISNHVMYKEKSALKQAIRNKGYNKFLPKDFDLYDIFDNDEDILEVLKDADSLIGKFRLHSLHCGGIVIFNDTVPKKYLLKDFNIYHNKKKKYVIGSQLNLNKDDVEDLNFIKIDVLSNRGLSQLMECSDLPLINYKYDKKVYKLFCDGNNLGLTYGESRGMRRIFMELQPNCIDDLAIALALIRPAASKNGQKFNFLKNFHMMGKVERDDYIIFDDDAIDYIARLLKISRSEADLYRKAFAKRKYRKKAEFRQYLAFYRPDIKSKKRNLIYEQLCCLEEYSFCKSHAYSYAYLLYGLAYQKVYYNKKFWDSTIKHCNSSYRSWVHHREAITAGVDITKYRKNPKIDISSNPIEEYFKRGYWESLEFLPGMFCNVHEEKVFDPKLKKQVKQKKYYFKGLVATSKLYVPDRNIKKFEDNKDLKKSKYLTFITLGYDNSKYIDIVVWGRYNMSKIHCIKGTAIMKDEGWILTNRFVVCYI